MYKKIVGLYVLVIGSLWVRAERNPFCFDRTQEPTHYACLGIGTMAGKAKKVAVIQIGDTTGTVCKGAVCNGHTVVAVHDTCVIVKDARNRERRLELAKKSPST